APASVAYIRVGETAMGRGLLVMLGLLAVMAMATPVPRLTVVDDTAGTAVVCRSLAHGERVTLAFTHSMYGGDVHEEYMVTRQGRLRRVAMRTAHPAAADYYAHTANVVREGEMYRIEIPVAEFAAIAVRIDEVGRPRLIFRDHELDLLTATGHQHRVIIGATLSNRFAGDACR
ncbi:MAG: DUF1850 domain-containing protein, partial [Chloroflexota bacterium]|nr:DUF1850 domain-containing protein [Chloroflexota bacterium]